LDETEDGEYKDSLMAALKFNFSSEYELNSLKSKIIGTVNKKIGEAMKSIGN